MSALKIFALKNIDEIKVELNKLIKYHRNPGGLGYPKSYHINGITINSKRLTELYEVRKLINTVSELELISKLKSSELYSAKYIAGQLEEREKENKKL